MWKITVETKDLKSPYIFVEPELSEKFIVAILTVFSFSFVAMKIEKI